MKIAVVNDDGERQQFTEEVLLWKSDGEGELFVVAGRTAPPELKAQGRVMLWLPIAQFAAGGWASVLLLECPPHPLFERWANLQLKQDAWRPTDLM